MSTKPLDRYPREYSALFLKARKGSVRVKFPDARSAHLFRRSLYNFRDALAEAEGRVRGYERVMLVAPLARMQLEGSTLIISYPKTSENTNEHSKPRSTRRKR